MKFYVQFDENGFITATNSLPDNLPALEGENILKVDALPDKEILWKVKDGTLVPKTKTELLESAGLNSAEYNAAPAK